MDFKRRDLSDYCIFGDIDIEKIKVLHNLVLNFRERFLKDHAVQNVLLNRGEEIPNDKRPESYHNYSLTIIGAETSIHLATLNYMINMATSPKLTIVKSPGVLLAGEEKEDILETPEGHNALYVETLQREWMENPQITKILREYQRTLTDSFGEFTAQFILARIDYSNGLFVPPEWKEERAVLESIAKAFSIPAFHALDSAYYEKGRIFLKAAGPLWQQLSKDNFGARFTLSQEEVRQYLKNVIMDSSYNEN